MLRNCATHLCELNGVINWPRKDTPLYICVTPPKLKFCIKGCSHIYRSTPKISERWNYALLGWEAWLTPRYMSPDMCYHVKSGSSTTKGVCTNIKEPQNYGALGHRPHEVGAWLTPKISPFPVCITTSNLVVLRQRMYAQIEKNQKIGERCDPAHLGWGMADRLKRSRPHVC